MHKCLYCEKEIKYKYSNLYCDPICHKKHMHDKRILEWMEGRDPGWTGNTRQLKEFVRNFIHTERGTKCEECGWDERHPIDNKVLTEIDHIDGNAENCHLSNLKILCPNCHSKTPTFRARNKVSKRNRKQV